MHVKNLFQDFVAYVKEQQLFVEAILIPKATWSQQLGWHWQKGV